MQSFNWEQLTHQTSQAVRDTAVFLQEQLGQVQPGQIEEKFRNGLVSYVDRGAEQMLVERLTRLLPTAGFLTEEETVQQQDAELQWIVDPLDGTTNFLHGVPHFSISVGLKAGDELVLGVVYHVSYKEMFYAWQGGGAWCNGQSIRVSNRTVLRQSLISTGFPYHDFERAEAWSAAFNQFMRQCRGLRRFGSAALDLAYVACGRFDVFFEYGLSPWDVAGGVVLVREAGGQVSDFSGGSAFLDKQELLAGNGLVFADALQIVQAAFSEEIPPEF